MQCAKAFTGFLFWNKQREHFLLNFTKQLLFEKVNFAPVISNEKRKNNKKWRDNSKISKYVSSTISNDNNCVTGYEVSGMRQIYFGLKAVWKKHLPNQIGTIFNLSAKQHSWFGPHLIHWLCWLSENFKWLPSTFAMVKNVYAQNYMTAFTIAIAIHPSI